MRKNFTDKDNSELMIEFLKEKQTENEIGGLIKHASHTASYPTLNPANAKSKLSIMNVNVLMKPCKISCDSASHKTYNKI